MTGQATAIRAALREQAHIDRRAPVTVLPQMLNADMKGRKPPRIVPVAA